MTTRNTATLLVIGLATAFGLLSACALVPAQLRGQGTYDGPTEPHLLAERVWASAEQTMAEPVAVLDDQVVLADPKSKLSAIDRSGEVRWQLPPTLRLKDGAEAAELVGSVGRTLSTRPDGVIVAPYKWDWCAANSDFCYRQPQQPTADYGVVGLSLADGRPQWSVVLEPSVAVDPGDHRESPDLQVRLVTDTVALVEWGPELGASLGRSKTVALDPRTGQELWSKDDLGSSWATEDRVLGVFAGPSGTARDGTPVLLDARTGAEVWRSPKPSLWSDTFGTKPTQDSYGYGTVLRPLGDEEGPAATAIDLATGSTRSLDDLDNIGHVIVGRGSDGPFFAWTGIESLYSAGTTAEGPPARAEHKLGIPIDGAVGGYLWVTDWAGGRQGATTKAVDRTGEVRFDPVPGILKLATADWLVVQGAEQEQTVIYRLILAA